MATALALGSAACTTSTDAATDVATPRNGGHSETIRSTGVLGSTEIPLRTDAPLDIEPTLTPGIEGDTLTVATTAMMAFCRPTLDYPTWINELNPFLTQHAGTAYETVDPANVSCTTLTAPATVRDGDGAFTMRILVPTDAGDYSVYVHRAVETGPWAVESITPLASE